jgi:hypothetical protein
LPSGIIANGGRNGAASDVGAVGLVDDAPSDPPASGSPPDRAAGGLSDPASGPAADAVAKQALQPTSSSRTPSETSSRGVAEPATPTSSGSLPDEVDATLLANLVFDTAARLPDGSYFVPKPTQRLFGLRTTRVGATDVRPTVKLPGRIVPDPHSHGDVEASLLGRIEAAPSGLPVLGDHVTRGQILGFVTPAIGVVDRTQVRREVARLTTEIRLETEALERMNRFWFVPFRDGKRIQAQMKIDGLRRERDALLPMLQIREVLRASIDGVVSRSTAILGRIVHPGEMIFEIVDPRSLWVEANAQDPQVAEVATRVKEATALTPDGDLLRLTFVGSGLTLEQQMAPLLLRIDDPTPELRVGRPVTVTIRTEAAARHGIVVPRAALAVGNDGVTEVWVQTAPEQFMPHPVRTEDIDGASTLVVGGLGDQERVVVRGIKLLTQLN